MARREDFLFYLATEGIASLAVTEDTEDVYPR